MSIFRTLFGSRSDSFENELLDTIMQVNLSLGKIQEGMRTYLQRYCKEHDVRIDTQTEEQTFSWLISGQKPKPDKYDLACEYVEILKSHIVVKQVFSTAMVFKINQLTMAGMMVKAMELVDNLNALGLPPYSLSLQLPDEKAFISMANDFHLKSKTMSIPIQSRGFTGDRDRYQIKKEIGRGGFGTVFHAHDTKLRRDVAIKRLNVDRNNSDQIKALRMYEREAQAIASLNHPCIVQIYDLEEASDGYRIIMEYVPGISLDKYLSASGGALDEMIALKIFSQICSGLDHAHANGVIHRDIKPGNIFIGRDGDTVKIGDFGISLMAGDKFSTNNTTIAGTKLYAAPEQYNAAIPLSPAVDVYSATKVFYEMLTGTVGFIVDVENILVPKKYVSLLRLGLAREPSARELKDVQQQIAKLQKKGG